MRLDWPEEEYGSEPCPNEATGRVGIFEEDGTPRGPMWACEAHKTVINAEGFAFLASGEKPVKVRPVAWYGD